MDLKTASNLEPSTQHYKEKANAQVYYFSISTLVLNPKSLVLLAGVAQ